MAELFASGRIVDLILVLMAVETVFLLVRRRLTGRGPPPAGVIALLVPGAFLLLALRAALTGAAWTIVALWLAAALAAHLADLALHR